MNAPGTFGRWIGIGVRGVLLASVPLIAWISQAMAADSAEGSVIADRFRRLTRESTWRKADEVRLNFRTYHPQGMAVVGDRFFLSSVEVIDRGEGRGVGHLFEVDFRGNLLRQARLGEGSMYHPGGIDFDGRGSGCPSRNTGRRAGLWCTGWTREPGDQAGVRVWGPPGSAGLR